jgi:hypothetical protein
MKERSLAVPAKTLNATSYKADRHETAKESCIAGSETQ